MCHHVRAVFCIFAPARPEISQNYIDLSFMYVSVLSPGLIRARGRNWVWLNKRMTILMRLCQGSRDTCLHREHSKRYHVKLLKKSWNVKLWMVQVVICWPLSLEACVCSQASLCGIYGGQSRWDRFYCNYFSYALSHFFCQCYMLVFHSLTVDIIQILPSDSVIK